MHRAVLLTLLAIPILVIMHIALFWQPIPWGKEMLWTASQDGTQLRGNWQTPGQPVPARFVIDGIAERGS
jgi:hypothetical protein